MRLEHFQINRLGPLRLAHRFTAGRQHGGSQRFGQLALSAIRFSLGFFLAAGLGEQHDQRNAWFAGFNVGYCDRRRLEGGDAG